MTARKRPPNPETPAISEKSADQRTNEKSAEQRTHALVRRFLRNRCCFKVLRRLARLHEHIANNEKIGRLNNLGLETEEKWRARNRTSGGAQQLPRVIRSNYSGYNTYHMDTLLQIRRTHYLQFFWVDTLLPIFPPS